MLVSVAVLATGCSRKLIVGVILPETGEAAAYGASIKSGVKLAFDDAFANRTVPTGLEVVYRDSGSDPALATSMCEAFYDEGALVVIGGATSPEATAMIPIADKRDRVLVSPSASAPDLARMSVYFFRVFPSDELEGVRAADLLVLTSGARTALILQEDNEYARGLLPVFMGEFKNQGGRVVGSVEIGPSGWEQETRDMIAAHQPQGIYVFGYGERILDGLRLLRAVNYGGAICTTSAINTARFLQSAGDLAEGVFLPLSSIDTTSKEEPIATFVRRYQQVYNLLPDSYAAHGY
ncbi:MAG: ABC transporter substrate-binding protein, partial [Deltaproteobacteria bacterium]|nr:ABC transporter substrate-binding protein [Deltaproteobacteria bacterium]